MFFVYSKVRFLVPVSGLFWEQSFLYDVTWISFWKTSGLLVKCLHHKRNPQFLIIKQHMIQIIQPSVNFLWVALASDWQKYFTYIDVLTQKQIGSLSTSKGYMNESFLLCNSKIYVLLIPLI